MSKSTNIITFAIGVTVGSIVAWCYTARKYDQIAQEEIDSVKEMFSKRQESAGEDLDTVRIKANQAKEKPNIAEYTARLREHAYTNYSNVSTDNKKEEDATPMDINGPHIITPEEFDDENDYEKITLTCYADHVLADENDEPLDDIDNIVGLDSLTHFGEYEDDSVYIRNDKLTSDFEILLDQRDYSDVVGRRPHEVRD